VHGPPENCRLSTINHVFWEGKIRRKNSCYMIIKFDVASSAVSRLKFVSSLVGDSLDPLWLVILNCI